MRLLITGATGFLGRHILAALSTNSPRDVAVISWDRKAYGDLLNEDHRNRALEHLQPTVVLHLAWRHTGVPGYELDEANRLWAQQTIAMTKTCIKRGITVWLGGSLSDKDMETTSSAYMQSKRDVSEFCLSVQASRKVSLLEFSYIYSVEEGRPRAMRAFQDSSYREAFILNDPDTLRDYLEVTDAAKGIVLLLGRENPSFISVCSGMVRSTADLLLRSVREETRNYALARQVRVAQKGTNRPDYLRQLGWRPSKTDLYFRRGI